MSPTFIWRWFFSIDMALHRYFGSYIKTLNILLILLLIITLTMSLIYHLALLDQSLGVQCKHLGSNLIFPFLCSLSCLSNNSFCRQMIYWPL